MEIRSNSPGDSLTIVIPVLNDAVFLARLLPYLRDIAPGSEIIVVDGVSSDDSQSVAARYAQVITSPRGRGRQLNAGASAATRPILWFLHADSLPHRDSIKAIELTMATKSYVAGGFEYEFFENDWNFRFLAWTSNIKNRLKRQLYGDMGVFISREQFFAIGGFRQAYLMEDFEFGRRLRRSGRVAILPLRIKTSSRDWRRTGVIRKVFKDALIRTAFLMKTDEKTLYRWYYGSRHESEI